MATKTSPKKSNSNKLSPGDHWSRNSYGTIIEVSHDAITVENDQGVGWRIDASLFEAEFSTVDQFVETKKITRTEMVNKIVSSARVAMTIFFRKKPEHKTLVDLVDDLLGDSVKPSRRALSAQLKTATAGVERTMIGRHFGGTDEFGRIQFLDVEQRPGSSVGLKTVDPRTIEWCIIENVRYEIK